MALFKQIELINFRLLKQFTLEPVTGINLLCGDNATGKTSILEALWYLSSGQSFRTKQLDELIYNPFWQKQSGSTKDDSKKNAKQSAESEQNFFRVNAQILATNTEKGEELSIYRKIQKNHFLYAGNIQKNAMINARKIPLLLITPDSLTLVGGSPQRRRNNLNWGCFYHYPLYQQVHARYQRALKQRNRLLKQKKRMKR